MEDAGMGSGSNEVVIRVHVEKIGTTLRMWHVGK